jgi:hypothetical protein
MTAAVETPIKVEVLSDDEIELLLAEEGDPPLLGSLEETLFEELELLLVV